MVDQANAVARTPLVGFNAVVDIIDHNPVHAYS